MVTVTRSARPHVLRLRSRRRRCVCVEAVQARELESGALREAGDQADGLVGVFDHLDRCTTKSIGRKTSCRVRVAYLPVGAGTSDSATLTASGEHGAAASLSLSGSSAGPSGHLYWANAAFFYGPVGVSVVPRGGGNVTTLAGGEGIPVAVAVDDTNVYWIADAYNIGTVNEVPVGGGSVTTLASGQSGPVSLAVDGTNVYWVNGGAGR